MESDDFLANVLARTRHQGPSCTVHQLLATIEADDPALADGIRKALVHPLAKSTVIGELLRSKHHVISDETIQRHRRGACRCARDDAA